MKAENFCFWLQGFFELGQGNNITKEQVEQIKIHLALVFKYDPAMEHPAPQKKNGISDIVQKRIEELRKEDIIPERRSRCGYRPGVLYC